MPARYPAHGSGPGGRLQDRQVPGDLPPIQPVPQSRDLHGSLFWRRLQLGHAMEQRSPGQLRHLPPGQHVLSLGWRQTPADRGRVGKSGTRHRRPSLPLGQPAAQLRAGDHEPQDAGQQNGAGCGAGTTNPVNSKPGGASPYGALDMSGNVFEWTSDNYQADYYQQRELNNPKGPATNTGYKTLRGGGSWMMGDVEGLDVSVRAPYAPEGQGYIVGFRCAK